MHPPSRAQNHPSHGNKKNRKGFSRQCLPVTERFSCLERIETKLACAHLCVLCTKTSSRSRARGPPKREKDTHARESSEIICPRTWAFQSNPRQPHLVGWHSKLSCGRAEIFSSTGMFHLFSWVHPYRMMKVPLCSSLDPFFLRYCPLRGRLALVKGSTCTVDALVIALASSVGLEEYIYGGACCQCCFQPCRSYQIYM
jgi:hypothetical protein